MAWTLAQPLMPKAMSEISPASLSRNSRGIRPLTLHNRRLLSLIWIAVTVGALLYVFIVVKGGLKLTPLLSNLALPL